MWVGVIRMGRRNGSHSHLKTVADSRSGTLFWVRSQELWSGVRPKSSLPTRESEELDPSSRSLGLEACGFGISSAPGEFHDFVADAVLIRMFTQSEFCPRSVRSPAREGHA